MNLRNAGQAVNETRRSSTDEVHVVDLRRELGSGHVIELLPVCEDVFLTRHGCSEPTQQVILDTLQIGRGHATSPMLFKRTRHVSQLLRRPYF